MYINSTVCVPLYTGGHFEQGVLHGYTGIALRLTLSVTAAKTNLSVRNVLHFRALLRGIVL